MLQVVEGALGDTMLAAGRKADSDAALIVDRALTSYAPGGNQRVESLTRLAKR